MKSSVLERDIEKQCNPTRSQNSRGANSSCVVAALGTAYAPKGGTLNLVCGTLPWPRPGPHGTRSASKLALPAMVVFGALVFTGASRRSLWLDEGVSVVLARMSFRDLSDAIRSGHGNMLGYYVVLWCWTRLGDSDAWVRALSGIFAVVSVPIFVAIITRLTPPKAAPLGVGLYVLHPFLLRYGQEARGYSLMLLVALVVVWRWLCYLERGGRWRWCVWVGAGGLLGYTHYYALTLIGIMAVGSVIYGRVLGKPKHLHVMAGVGSMVPMNLPVIVLAASHAGSGGLNWVRANSSIWDRAVGAAVDLAGNRIIPLALVIVVAACVAIRESLKKQYENEVRARLGVLVIWLSLPAASAVAAWPLQPLLVGRYFIFVLPALLMLAAMGTSLLGGLGKQRVMSVTLLLASAVGVAMWKQRPPEEDWRSATAFVLERSRPGDGVVGIPWFVRAPVEAYAGRDRRRVELVPLYPEAAWGRYVPGVAPKVLEPSLLAKEVGLRGVSRVWVFVRTGAVSGRAVAERKAVRGAFGDRAEVVRSFKGVRVERYGIRSVSAVVDHDSPG